MSDEEELPTSPDPCDSDYFSEHTYEELSQGF